MSPKQKNSLAKPEGGTNENDAAAALERVTRTVSSERVPLRAIAEKAGVSRMTVSLALRDHSAITAETKKKVQEIARQLGYRPDPVVSALMSNLRRATRVQNVGALAVITNSPGGLSWSDIPTHRAYYEGARAKAASLGFQLEEFRLNHGGMTERRATQIMWSRGIEGGIIFPTLNQTGTFELKADISKLSCATIAYSLQAPLLHRSCVHHFRVAMEAANQLRQLGYRRIGLALDSNQDRRSGHNWRAGFLAAEHLHTGQCLVPPLIVEEITHELFAGWFRDHKPDALLHLPNQNEGFARIFDWVKRLGLRVPDDVGYASLDLPPESSATSGMEQYSALVGAAAVDLVISGLLHHEWGVPLHAKTVMIGGEWRAGKTTRKQA